MEKLKNIYLKDINREIQGVIKVDDESFIKQELEEYVVTEELLKHFRAFFDAYNVGINGTTEHMGVWISGFFGSGKSHFLKILSYLLDNKEVDGKKAVDYFDGKIKDPILLANMKRAGQIPSDVILFNIDSKASIDTMDGKDRILSVFEKVFNEKMGLSTIPHVAELERFLIKNNKYESFKAEIKNTCNAAWEDVRNDFYFREDEIVDSYSKTMGKSKDEAKNWFEKAETYHDISIEKFAERIKEYIESCGDNRHVVFLVDEVGQYIGGDRQALLNLQTIVEDLGRYCGGKAWVCVTSQQAIDEVVKVHSDEFSKIQGRFDTKLSLSSSDTDEVIKKRILDKTAAAKEALEQLYDQKEAIIKNLYSWSKAATQKTYEDREDFANTYPFVPYQFRLLQDVFTDIRTSGYAGKHLSSGERSLLGAFQETAKFYENSEIGMLVPFYAFYDTIEQFLEFPIINVFKKAKDIMKQGDLEEVDINVLKILFMLKNLNNDSIPTNVDNIAVLYASNIDTDKLKLKQDIAASLKRLEKQTLIQKNNEDYRFLTDDEQQINIEIKKEVVDNNKVEEFLKEMIYDKILTDRKFAYKRNNFELSLYLDNIKISAKEYEIGVKVFTPYASMQTDEIIKDSSFDQNSVYIDVNIPRDLDEEINNILKVEQYIKNTRNTSKPQNVQDIIRAKSREAEEARTRVETDIRESLSNADILISGDKQMIQSAEPKTRLYSALEVLVKNTYSKLGYIESNFTMMDVKSLFEEDNNHLAGTQVAFPNQKALDEIKDYILEKNAFASSITIRTILQDFAKSPYGYMESDILYLITKLLKEEVINLVYLNEVQNVNNPETLNKLLKREYYDKVVVKTRDKMPQELINDVKNIAKQSFDKFLPEDEDGMMRDFKEAIAKRYADLNRIAGSYPDNTKFQYPGKNLVNETVDLLDSLGKIRDITEFFEKISNNKDIINKNMAEIIRVEDFFKNQKASFDNAVKAVTFYLDNKEYADDSDELKTAVKEITDILENEEPYSDIPKLALLRDNLNNILFQMYEKKSKPIIELAEGVKTYINNELEQNKEVDSKIGEKYIDILDKIINELETSSALKDIFAKQAYIGQLKEEFITALDNSKNLLKSGETNDNSNPVPTRKVVRADILLNKTYEINSEEDIEKYLNDLRTKLIEELKNNNLTIR